MDMDDFDPSRVLTIGRNASLGGWQGRYIALLYDIDNLHLGQACRPSFPLQIAIEASHLSRHEASHLVYLTQHALDDGNEFSAHHLRLQLTDTRDPEEHVSTPGDNKKGAPRRRQSFSSSQRQGQSLTVRLIADHDIQTPQSKLQQHSTILDITYPPSQIPSPVASSSTLAVYIAHDLESLYSEEKALLEYVLTTSSASNTQANAREGRPRQGRSISSEAASKLAHRMTRSLKFASTYHLTISLFTPTSSPNSWDIEAAIQEYLEPLLKSLSSVSHFTVDTQVQLYAKFAPSTPPPQYDAEIEAFTLRTEDLSGFINAAEWPLSPSIGSGPTLNFILYVPHPANSPLVVREKGSTNWLIPQWGGVVIHDSDNSTSIPNKITKEQLRRPLMTFSHQLLSLLGSPQSPPSLPLQLQTLVRVQAAQVLLSASATLGSLASLTVALPSIAIPETVSMAVDNTLLQLKNTCAALREGRFEAALDHARIAETQAEKGFFEKSMVGQVYFPDEHKVAVYLPLLGPVGVPLLMSAVKEIRQYLARR